MGAQEGLGCIDGSLLRAGHKWGKVLGIYRKLYCYSDRRNGGSHELASSIVIHQDWEPKPIGFLDTPTAEGNAHVVRGWLFFIDLTGIYLSTQLPCLQAIFVKIWVLLHSADQSACRQMA